MKRIASLVLKPSCGNFVGFEAQCMWCNLVYKGCCIAFLFFCLTSVKNCALDAALQSLLYHLRPERGVQFQYNFHMNYTHKKLLNTITYC